MSRPKRVKKVVQPPQPPRVPRLASLAEQAQRAGWVVEWQTTASESQWWLRLRNNGVGVDAFANDGGSLNCYPQYLGCWSQPARTPIEALRSAYAALGVALDQAEDAFTQVQEQGEAK